MDNDDFFGKPPENKDKDKEPDQFSEFRPAQPKTGYNVSPDLQQQHINTIRKKDFSNKVLYVILAVFMAAFLFFAGFFTKALTDNEQTKVFSWALDNIEKYYIGDEVMGKQYTRDDYLKNGFSILDPYSRLLTPEEYQAEANSMAGSESGFGIAISIKKINGENKVIVSRVVWGSPAEGKLQAEDVIIEINGVATDANNYDTTVSGAIKEGENDFKVGRPTYNAENDTIEYVEVVVSLAQKEYKAEYLKYYDSQSQTKIENLPQGTAYIDFRQFNAPADTALASAMELYKLNGMKNIILDLRGNPGGYLNIAADFAGYFMKPKDSGKTVVMTTKYKNDAGVNNDDNTIYTPHSKYSNYNIEKLIVLIDEGSASASEVLLGAMIDSGAAIYTIGRQTYGKGIMQTSFIHASGYAITLTVAKWFTPNGVWVQDINAQTGKKGIVPNLTVEKNVKNYPYSYAGDSELLAAFDYLAA